MVSTYSTAPSLVDEVQPPPRLRMSYDEYQDWWDRGAGRRGEWVDGEVIVFIPTGLRHETLVILVASLLNFVVTKRRLGRVITPGYELRTREGVARQPDLQVVLTEHLRRATERRLLSASDIAIETISPDSVVRDRQDKFVEYQAAGVPEYWIIDPREGYESAQIFTIVGKEYVAVEPQGDGTLPSKIIPGVWFDPAWLLLEELPDPFDLAVEMVEANRRLTERR